MINTNGVVLLKIVMHKLNANETPEYRTPNGNNPTKIENNAAEINEMKQQKIKIAMAISQILFCAIIQNRMGENIKAPTEPR